MAKPSKKKALADASKNDRPIAENRKARREYEVLDTLECGIVLVGSEVKSLRKGTISLDEAYGRIKDGEVWLINATSPNTSRPTSSTTIPSGRASCYCIAAKSKSSPAKPTSKG